LKYLLKRISELHGNSTVDNQEINDTLNNDAGQLVWQKIVNCVVMSISAAEHNLVDEYKRIGGNIHKYVYTRRCWCDLWISMFSFRHSLPFEMVGYDILIDNNLNVWLLEINNTPRYSTIHSFSSCDTCLFSMAPHTQLENEIKKDLISDLFTLVRVSSV
jgi:hypothetical protein